MATTWGGTGIPDPTGWEIDDALIGAQYTTADGSLRTDSIATKRTIRVRWELITAAQRDTIYGKHIGTAAATLTFPNADSYSVIGLRNSYRAAPTGGASGTWTVSLAVREA